MKAPTKGRFGWRICPSKNEPHLSNPVTFRGSGAGSAAQNAGRINKSVDWLPQFKCADVFHVVGVGEHVDGLNLGKSVAVFNQILDIACLRVGVAGYVYDAL